MSGGVDRISNLPDEILSHILSLLSPREAVGTSVLSTRWRNLFYFLTNLDFDLDDKHLLCGTKPKSSTIDSFQSFVDRILFLYDAISLEKLRLICRERVYSHRLSSWISAAVWRGVEHLDLKINFIHGFFALPGVLFTSRTLVTLKLDFGHFVLNVPNDICFPNLKTLHLNSVEFLNDDSIKRLFSSCISLEDMVTEGCYLHRICNFNISHYLLKRLTIAQSGCYDFCMVIDAPMLVYFKYKAYNAGYSLVDLQSLESAHIDLLRYDDFDATSFFRGIRNVQSLNLSSTSFKLLLSCLPVPIFPNLVQLKIWCDYCLTCSPHFYWPGEEQVAGLLLSNVPELENLVLCQDLFNHLPKEVLFCLSCKLKAMEISQFEDEEDCIEKAKYFLENAGVLEMLTVRTKLNLDEEEKLEIKEELLSSPRKSKQCRIIIV